jgi:hypothetical protein
MKPMAETEIALSDSYRRIAQAGWASWLETCRRDCFPYLGSCLKAQNRLYRCIAKRPSSTRILFFRFFFSFFFFFFTLFLFSVHIFLNFYLFFIFLL